MNDVKSKPIFGWAVTKRRIAWQDTEQIGIVIRTVNKVSELDTRLPLFIIGVREFHRRGTTSIYYDKPVRLTPLQLRQVIDRYFPRLKSALRHGSVVS